jgi:hypothetical protein
LYIHNEHTTVPFVETAGAVANRKRPLGERPERLVVEYYGPEEIELARQVRAAAALRGQRVREWVLEALRQRLERDGVPQVPPGPRVRELPGAAEGRAAYRTEDEPPPAR